MGRACEHGAQATLTRKNCIRGIPTVIRNCTTQAATASFLSRAMDGPLEGTAGTLEAVLEPENAYTQTGSW
jgi:hypothetical protein